MQQGGKKSHIKENLVCEEEKKKPADFFPTETAGQKGMV